MKPIYFDNNATTKVDPEVFEEMTPYFVELYGNPSSMHSFGGQVAEKIKEARKRIADLINATPEEIIITSCGSESDNTAIYSALKSHPDKKHIVTSMVEHPAIKNLFQHLEKDGYTTTFVPVDNKGRLNMDVFYDSLSDNTAIVSLMWANNETGTMFPIDEIGAELKKRGITFHTDAVQALGKIDIDVTKTNIDMMSFSGHKIHAPKGVGGLYVRKGTKFSPFLIGGHQEGGKRAGTENLASIIGLGKACEIAKGHLDDGYHKLRSLRDRLENALVEKIPNSFVNGDLENRLPNTASISFEYIEGESILLMLNEYGICASSGSACTSGSLEPSHVLRAMGIPFTAAHGTIRFSLSVFSTDEEVDLVIEKMPEIIQRLRDMSPFWQEAINEGKVTV
ncbi:MAG: cysteine desulfurase NifS [Desulfobacterales bacterium]|nr:cysteine desulfurase NifS [Desulfobacterales bacterium]MCP4159236.1 cysteine desulfurase NifS [Deltaproteobacteria bacterium]